MNRAKAVIIHSTATPIAGHVGGSLAIMNTIRAITNPITKYLSIHFNMDVGCLDGYRLSINSLPDIIVIEFKIR